MGGAALIAYQRYGPALVRKAARMLGNREDAADVVHELFVDLWEKGEKRVDELPYLYRAIGNRCLNILRDSKRRRELLDRAHIWQTRSEGKSFELAQVAQLADKLDDKTMEILICRYVDEMTHEEIASHLRVSRRTVLNRLAKIREALEKLQSDVSPNAAVAR
jgi:RNA polymerase sigma-70 factor (ECF subfamily)